MKALILAAGYATRLYPITKEFPKPLLKIRQRPLIDYIIDKLDDIRDIDEIIVITNSKFISKFQRWTKGHLENKKRISLIDDLTRELKDRRGAIGDVDFAINAKQINDDLLIIGGDNLFEGSLKPFLSFAKAHRPAAVIGVYDIKNILEARKYGVIKLNKQNQLVDFKEKPEKPESTQVATCVYYFPKEKLSLINEYLNSGTDAHDATGFYIDWLRKRVPVYGFVFSGHWYDIGDHKFYNKAKQEFEGGQG